MADDFFGSIEEQNLYVPSQVNYDSDFIGFTFGDVKSSDLGIVRTSNGSRFEENLLPTLQDKVVQVPGGDGSYYFGSYYTNRPISISFSFDSMTESQYRNLKQVLGDKKIKDLILDETPYKVYRAKINTSATIKYLVFLENGERIYKGEGTIQFICYEPFARTPIGKKYLNQFSNTNVNEWKGAANLLEVKGSYDVTNAYGEAKLYNPGDEETDFYIDIPEENIVNEHVFSLSNGKSITIQGISAAANETHIRLDTKSNLLIGLKSDGQYSGNVYNDKILNGDFFKIPKDTSGNLKLITNPAIQNLEIQYRYLYL